ncbi:MAG: hypothetical protein KGP28_01675 [Bdellovibrionales bacterium]|nr:hypothetical protein [Bdellovibrionales bacterium]
MKHLTTIILILVGIIHLLPLSGVFGAERLSALYGIEFQDPNILILMRHRAVLFGIFGVFLMTAAFRPAWHLWAFTSAFVSVVSFMLLALSAGEFNQELHRVFMADLVALGMIFIGLLARFFAFRKP